MCPDFCKPSARPFTHRGPAAGGFAIGVTRRALDELMALAKTKVRVGAGAFLKDDERFLHALGSLESRFRSARAWLRDAFGRAERGVVETVRVDVAENNEGRQATVHVTQEGADIVRQAYLLAGAPCGTAPSSAASVTSTPAASTSSPAPPPPSITPGT